MPDYGFAIGSALAWAMAAQVVNRGLEHLPRRHRPLHLSLGLLASLATGTLLLGLVAPSGAVREISLWIVLAGLFTFPLGTGLYYLSGQLFSDRIEYASQFANVKPALSVLLALVFLGERLAWPSLVAIVLVVAGLASLLMGVRSKHFSLLAVVIGLLLATSWAFGELFMGLALDGRSSLSATFLALATGTLMWACVCAPVAICQRQRLELHARWLAPFFFHGVISFSLGYALFFESINRIGLSQSILINAFWPSLSVLLSILVDRLRARHRPVPRSIVAATALLLFASLLQIWSMR